MTLFQMPFFFGIWSEIEMLKMAQKYVGARERSWQKGATTEPLFSEKDPQHAIVVDDKREREKTDGK